MAKTYCINEHMLSDYDMKPTVWAFRIGFLKQYESHYPNTVFGDDFQPYDATEYVLNEDMNCWICDKCGNLIVFLRKDEDHETRLDFMPLEKPSSITDIRECATWDEYMALRDNDFDEFQDSVEGFTISEAIGAYKLHHLRYMVESGMKTILAFRSDGSVDHGYELKEISEIDMSDQDWYPRYKPYKDLDDKEENKDIDDAIEEAEAEQAKSISLLQG